MVQSTGRGISYPESTDHTRIWEHCQTLATTTDTAIGVVDTEVGALGVWQTYVTTWSSTGTPPTLGNGTLTSKYCQVGKLTAFSIWLVCGSTTTFGTGPYTFTLPFTPVNKGRQMASGSVSDVGVSNYVAFIYWINTVTCNVVTNGSGGAFANISNTAPFTFGSTDEMVFDGVYEAA